jgi:hypothetical protein
MTRNEAVEALRALAGEWDTETAHSEGDAVLCKLLISLGYEDVVAAWEVLPKWYS